MIEVYACNGVFVCRYSHTVSHSSNIGRVVTCNATRIMVRSEYNKKDVRTCIMVCSFVTAYALPSQSSSFGQDVTCNAIRIMARNIYKNKDARTCHHLVFISYPDFPQSSEKGR